jgi:hypothetical protein
MLGTILIVILVLALWAPCHDGSIEDLGILPKWRSWTCTLDYCYSPSSCPDLKLKGGYDVAF